MNNREYEDLGKRLGDWISRTSVRNGGGDPQEEAARLFSAVRKRRMKRIRSTTPERFGWTPIVATGVAVGFAMLAMFVFPMFELPKDTDETANYDASPVGSLAVLDDREAPEPSQTRRATRHTPEKRQNFAQPSENTKNSNLPPPAEPPSAPSSPKLGDAPKEKPRVVSVDEKHARQKKMPETLHAISESNLIRKIAKLEAKKALPMAKTAPMEMKSASKKEVKDDAETEETWKDNLSEKVKRSGCSDRMCKELREYFTEKRSAQDRRARELLMECLLTLERIEDYEREKELLTRKYEEDM